ncbi:TonB-dependent receptor [Glaciecola sp. MH2013]|nr:TonB-dependent receptor [Glaciecola sp. MH2013]
MCSSIFALNSVASAIAAPVQENTQLSSGEQSSESLVERILVTANRAPSNQLSTAASVDAVDQATLELIGHQHVNQALSRIAGTWISRGNGQEHLSAVRSPVLTGAGGCGAFFMALDGISLRAPGFCNANQLFDANTEQAQRIEVLRGPASTLYGSNAVHGVINVISPSAFTEQANYLGLRVGRDDHVKASFGYTTYGSGEDKNEPSEQSAFGLFGNITQNNGFQSDSGYDQQKITAVYEFNGDLWSNKTLVDIANLNQETAGFVQGFEAFKNPVLRKSNPNPEAFRDAKSARIQSRFSRDTEQGSFSVTPYARWNDMAFLQHFLPWKALEENSHSSIGLQSQYRFSKDIVSITSGVDFDLSNANLRETQDNDFSPSIPSGEHYDYDVIATSAAAYVQAQWDFSRWQMSIGGRLENVNYDYDNMLNDGNACDSTVSLCRFTRPADQEISFTVFSPSLSLLYLLSDEQSLYARLSQGYRAPQATELFRLQNNQTVADLSEEKLDALELGYRFVSKELTLSAAVFWQEKSNFIFQDSNRQNVSNGETSHKGIELSLNYDISDTVYASANMTFAEHEYTKALTLARSDIAGNEIDTAPRSLGSVQIAWELSADILAELSLQHLGNYFLDPANTAEYDGHNLIDLNVRYHYSDAVTFNANIYNLTDEDYAERADFGFGNYRYFVGQPQRIFFSAIWSW